MHDPHERGRHRMPLGPMAPPPFYRPGDIDDEPLGDVRLAPLIAGYLGIALHAVLAYFPFLFTLFVAPLPVIVGVYGAWLATWKLAIRWQERHPYLVLLLPVVEVAAWFAVMQVGWMFLGWPSLRFPENA